MLMLDPEGAVGLPFAIHVHVGVHILARRDLGWDTPEVQQAATSRASYCTRCGQSKPRLEHH
jgi:hypothetical protein